LGTNYREARPSAGSQTALKAAEAERSKPFRATSGYPTAPAHPTLGTALPRHSGAAGLGLLKIQESELLKKTEGLGARAGAAEA